MNGHEARDERETLARLLSSLEVAPEIRELVDDEPRPPHYRDAEAVLAWMREAGYQKRPEAEITDGSLWDFAGDLLDAWNIEDLNPPSLAEQFRDLFVARFGSPAGTVPA